jgi:anti-sigma B factor antagonist
MELRTTYRVCCGRVVLKPSGRLCILECSLQRLIRDLLDGGHRRFVLNLADVRYIDCWGLGQLITIRGWIENVHGDLTLCSLGKEIRKLFQITKLDCVFQIETSDNPIDNNLTVLRRSDYDFVDRQ